MEIYCGIDWAEDHHDITVVDRDGKLLARRRISDDPAGLAGLPELLAPRAAAAELTDGDHRGQLPPSRCQPLPARTGQADGLIRLSGRIPAGGDTRSIIMSPGQSMPRGPR